MVSDDDSRGTSSRKVLSDHKRCGINDGGGKTKLNGKKSHSLKISGDYLFYICENGLYKTRIDGATTVHVISVHDKKQKLVRIVHVTGKWVFYLDYWEDEPDEKNYLSRIRTDGKRVKTFENKINFAVNVKKWIFYSRHDGGLYKIDANKGSRSKIKLCDDKTDYIYFEKNWIYYHNLSDDGKPYTIRVNGTRRQIVD